MLQPKNIDVNIKIEFDVEILSDEQLLNIKGGKSENANDIIIEDLIDD